jgi:hypothetical protein
MDWDSDDGATAGSLPRLSIATVVDDRLLWITRRGSNSCDWMSGVPSLLGLGGGVDLDDAIGPCRVDDKALPGARDEIILPADPVLACRPGRRRREDVVLVASSSWILACLDDVLSGGLGGGGDSCCRALALLSFLSPSRTVELEDDDVSDSRTAASPSGSALRASTSLLPALLRVTALTGGLVCAGLPVSLTPLGGGGMGIRMGAASPGDCEAIDVGVVSRL